MTWWNSITTAIALGSAIAFALKFYTPPPVADYSLRTAVEKLFVFALTIVLAFGAKMFLVTQLGF